MLVGFEGGAMPKNMASKGVQPENMVCEGVGGGGHPKNFL